MPIFELLSHQHVCDAYTMDAARARLSLRETEFKRLIKDGDLFCYRIGNRTFVPAVEIDRFVNRMINAAIAHKPHERSGADRQAETHA